MISDSSDIYDQFEDIANWQMKRETSDYLQIHENNNIQVLGLSGIVNIGNTCYMNSALQCLSASDIFTSYLIGSSDTPAQYKDDLKNSIIIELMKKKNCNINELTEKEILTKFKESLTYMLHKLFSVMWNKNCKVKPIYFKHTLGKKRPMFSGYQQHDSQECLSFILDKIHDETKSDASINFVNTNEEQKAYIEYYEDYQNKINNQNLSKEDKLKLYRKHMDYKKNKLELDTLINSLFFWKYYLRNNHSAIIDIFTGLFYTQIKCNSCFNISTKFDPYNIISLPIQSHRTNEIITLEHCFDLYFGVNEKLKDDNKYSCEYCDCKTDADMKSELWSIPQKLIIQLKRFSGYDKRINTNVNYPMDNFNIGKYLNEYVKKDILYELYGVIMHVGNIHFGHYIAFTKNPINNEWYLFDDSNVLHVDSSKIENAIQNNKAYILFYKIK